MARVMKNITFLSAIFTLSAIVIYAITDIIVIRILAIVFGVTFYHFAIRLLIGWFYQAVLNNTVNYRLKWFQTTKTETEFYRKIRVKRWKNALPTYEPKSFDSRNNSYEKIAMAMCQAELVHETIIVFSFLPVLLTFFFGSFVVFLTTSILSAGVDALFVMIQRYNRPRILRLLKKHQQYAH